MDRFFGCIPLLTAPNGRLGWFTRCWTTGVASAHWRCNPCPTAKTGWKTGSTIIEVVESSWGFTVTEYPSRKHGVLIYVTDSSTCKSYPGNLSSSPADQAICGSQGLRRECIWSVNFPPSAGPAAAEGLLPGNS